MANLAIGRNGIKVEINFFKSNRKDCVVAVLLPMGPLQFVPDVLVIFD